jgi:hypothetical protein
MALAEQMRSLGDELFERVRATDLLRDDIAFRDIGLLLKLLAGVTLGDPDCAAESDAGPAPQVILSMYTLNVYSPIGSSA